MLKKKILPVAMILSVLFVFGACSPVVEKEPEQKEPPVSENIPEEEEEPTGYDEEILEVSEEYEDQAVEIAMYALTNFFNKSEDFSDEDRREALKDITHPDYMDHLETQNQIIDTLEFISIDEIEVLGAEIHEESIDENTTVPKYIVVLGYKETVKEPGNEMYEELMPSGVVLMIHENQFKLRGFVDIEFAEEE